MKKRNKIKNEILAYIHEALDEKTKQKVIEKAKKEKAFSLYVKRARTISQYVEETPVEKPDIDFNTLLAQAKRRESENITVTKQYKNSISEVISIIKNKIAYQIGFGSIMIGLFIGCYFLFARNDNRLYFIRASGEVYIDQQSIFEESQTSYSLKKNMKISVNKGECLFQISKEKLILLNEHSSVDIIHDDKIYIDLHQGRLFGKVIKNKKADNLVIILDNSCFEIIGTVFSASKLNDKKEFEVEQGIVKGYNHNGSVILETGEKAMIERDKEFTITKKEDTSFHHDDYKRIKMFTLFQNPDNNQNIIIKGNNKETVYYNNNKIGSLPLFINEQKGHYDYLMISCPGFLSQELVLGKKTQYIIDSSPERRTDPVVKWSIKLKDKIFSNPYHIHGYILVADNSGTLYKIDPLTKKIIWEFVMDNRNIAVPYYYEGVLYIPSSSLYALDFDKGSLFWKKDIDSLIYSNPVIYKNRLYACSSTGFLFCLKQRSGEILWKKKIDKGFFSSPALVDQYLLIGGLSGTFYSIDLKTGKVMWRFNTDNRIVSSQAIVNKDIIYFGSNDKNLYALDSNTGKLKWKYITDSEIFTSPVFVDDSVIIATVGGKIHSLNRENGKLHWVYNIQKKVLFTPEWMNNKYLFIITHDEIVVLNRWGQLIYKYNHDIDGCLVLKNNLFITKDSAQLLNLKIPLN